MSWRTTGARDGRRGKLGALPPIVAALPSPGTRIWANRERDAHGRPISVPSVVFGGDRRCVTPRQACPRPNGLGRNLRSKTRWFTGFCNSHQVSHFATFFIDARAEISVAESRFRFSQERRHGAVRARTADGAATVDVLFFYRGSLARFAPGVRCCAAGDEGGRPVRDRLARLGWEGVRGAEAPWPPPGVLTTRSLVVLRGGFRQ